MKFNELYTIEKHIIKFIQEKLDYEFIPAEEFSKLRTFENEFIITSHLLESVQKINSVDENLAQSVVREIKKLDTNEAFLFAMRNGVNLKDPATGKNRDFHIVDLLIDNNLIEPLNGKSLSKEKYLEIERVLENFSREVNLNLAELDLYLWYIETGKILK